MNTKKYRWILYIITITVIATITVQIYWNYKNYLQNKQQVANEIQLSLDNAIEEYFADVTKKSTITYKNSTSNHTENAKNFEVFYSKVKLDSLFKSKGPAKKLKRINSDILSKSNNHISSVNIFKGKNIDSIKGLNEFANKIFISISQDSIEYPKIDSLLKKQLNNKNIIIDYRLKHSAGDSIIFKSDASNLVLNWIGVNSKSTFLKNNEQFRVLFKDPSLEALKRS